MPRVATPLVQALKMADLQLDQVDQVALVGAVTRVSIVQEEIHKSIGSKKFGRFLNTDKAIASEALYQAAHLSKGFKVKPFGVEELVSGEFEFDEEINSRLFDEAFNNPLEFDEEFDNWLGLDEEFND
ncbi:hypothetical protein TELCIR_11686 [Teladorsagia circumcincta]|uniref:Hypoxia up-regulated protein 1 n=1 Tax=Teladorsagia circumcincta TaxID=45464 RepID=A0A2G9U8K4_TELCI|nr:hypothetical protein TELCIR_11686 [Teladorsagia circumcincta]